MRPSVPSEIIHTTFKGMLVFGFGSAGVWLGGIGLGHLMPKPAARKHGLQNLFPMMTTQLFVE